MGTNDDIFYQEEAKKLLVIENYDKIRENYPVGTGKVRKKNTHLIKPNKKRK